MAFQTFSLGAEADDGTGEALRGAFERLLSNDAELYAAIAGLLDGIDPERDSLKKLADLIAGLTTALDGKSTPAQVAAALDALTVADIDGLDDALDEIGTALAARQPLDDGLTEIAALATQAYGRSLLTGADAGAVRTLLALGSAALASTGTAAGNVPVLDGSGKLLASLLPGLAITDTFEVASQAAMLALTAERGDVAIRTDLSKTFALAAEPASTLANWKELRTPTDTVLAVAGLTGTITAAALKAALAIAIGDVSGLSAALADKAPSASAVLTGATSIQGIKVDTIAKGNSGTAAQTFDVSAAAVQTITVTGAHNWTFTGWGTEYSEVEIIATNAGAFAIMLPAGIKWLKGDGTTSTTFADQGVTLQAAGVNHFLFWSPDGGTTIYGRAG